MVSQQILMLIQRKKLNNILNKMIAVPFKSMLYLVGKHVRKTECFGVSREACGW